MTNTASKTDTYSEIINATYRILNKFQTNSWTISETELNHRLYDIPNINNSKLIAELILVIVNNNSVIMPAGIIDKFGISETEYSIEKKILKSDLSDKLSVIKNLL